MAGLCPRVSSRIIHLGKGSVWTLGIHHFTSRGRPFLPNLRNPIFSYFESTRPGELCIGINTPDWVFSPIMCEPVVPAYLPVKIPAITRFTFAKPYLHSSLNPVIQVVKGLLMTVCSLLGVDLNPMWFVSAHQHPRIREDRKLFGELKYEQRRPETQFEAQMLRTEGTFSSRIAINDYLVEASGGSDSVDSRGLKIEESEEQSNLIATQVISLHCALNLGFVFERFLLDDITQVGYGYLSMMKT